MPLNIQSEMGYLGTARRLGDGGSPMTASSRISEERVLDRFLHLVQIDSVSFQEAPITRVLEQALHGLGFSVVNDGTGLSTGNLIAHLAGNCQSSTPIAFNAHMDTVEPGRGIQPVVKDRVVWSSGDTILAADCKASIAAILEGVMVSLEAGSPRPDLELIFTYGEERGHAGAKGLNVSTLGSRMCFTLDAEAAVGTIITSAPAYYSMKASFKGRAAHSGIAPEEGIDALVAASRAIARMPLGRIDEQTTANIGLIRGGSARNTVPALVELEGEARSRDDARLATQVDAMTRAMREEASRAGVTLDLQFKMEYNAFNIAPDAPPVVMACKALERLGLPVTLGTTGGGSDANDLNNRGLPTVVLGTGMAKAHTVEEHIAVADLVSLSQVVVELMAAATR